jgi:hypothetical protein
MVVVVVVVVVVDVLSLVGEWIGWRSAGLLLGGLDSLTGQPFDRPNGWLLEWVE